LRRFLPHLTLVALGLFWVASMPLAFTGLDAGELGAASAELSVAHPPGFAAFVTTRHALTRLPFADIAARIALGSVLMAALGAAAAVALCLRLGASRLAASTPPLALLASPVFGLHATTTEVYADLPLWMIGAVTMATQARRDPRALLGLAVLCGLALGHHAELRLFGLALAPAALWPWRRSARAWLGAALSVLAGALGVLHLPLAAARGPMRNWADPSTPSALWDVLTGARIRAAYSAEFLRFDALAAEAFITQHLGSVLLMAVLALGGLGARLRRARAPAHAPEDSTHRAVVAAFAALAALDSVYATALNPMGVPDAQNGVPLAFACAVLVGVLTGRGWSPAALFVALCAAAVPASASLFEGASDRVAAAVLDRTLDDVPISGVVFAASDDLAAGAAFAQTAEAARPDVAVVVRQHAWDASSLDPTLRRLPTLAPGWRVGDGLAALLVSVDTTRPWRWEWARGLDAEALPRPVLDAAPLASPQPPSRVPLEVVRSTAESLTRMGAVGSGAALRRWLVHQASDLGLLGRSTDPRDETAAALEVACAAGLPGDAAPCVNLGATLFEWGQGVAARHALERARALNANDEGVYLNLARVSLNAADADDALTWLAVGFDDALWRTRASAAQALALRGLAHAQRADWREARADLEAARALVPDQPDALTGLGALGDSGR